MSDIIVDKELYSDLIKIKWKIKVENGAVFGRIDNKKIEMQKLIMDHQDKNTIIFHIDYNKLNNKLSNLIEIPKNIYKMFNLPDLSPQEGTSIYTGIFYDRNVRKWRSKLGSNQIGYFRTEELAYQARKEALEKLKAQYLPNYEFRTYFENLQI